MADKKEPKPDAPKSAKEAEEQAAAAREHSENG